jgi:hypothetical protein
MIAGDMRKQDAGALEDMAVFDDTADAAAAFCALPGVGCEAAAVDRLEAGHDPLLKSLQIVPHGGGIDRFGR